MWLCVVVCCWNPDVWLISSLCSAEAKQSLSDERAQLKRGARSSEKTKGQLYDKVTQGQIEVQKEKVEMENEPAEDKVKADCPGPATFEDPKKMPIQHRWRRVGTKAGKDSQMEEDKDSEDAAQYKRLRNKIELEKQYADKENSDKSEPSGPGASFDDKPNNPSVGIHHEAQSITLNYRTRSKRKAAEVKLSEGQKSARAREGLLSHLCQGLLRVGASRSRVFPMILYKVLWSGEFPVSR